MKELVDIQAALNAPKDKRNDFGKYNYRSAESILKSVKPLLKKTGCTLLLSDEVKEVGTTYTYHTDDPKKGKTLYEGTRVYIVATATLINSNGETLSTKGYAREEVAKAGMDASQITGAASSYARKYALCGLFAIDDGNDADRLNNCPQYTAQQTVDGNTPSELFNYYAKPAIEQAITKADLAKVWNDYPTLQTMSEFTAAMTGRRKALGIKNSNE